MMQIVGGRCQHRVGQLTSATLYPHQGSCARLNSHRQALSCMSPAPPRLTCRIPSNAKEGSAKLILRMPKPCLAGTPHAKALPSSRPALHVMPFGSGNYTRGTSSLRISECGKCNRPPYTRDTV